MIALGELREGASVRLLLCPRTYLCGKGTPRFSPVGYSLPISEIHASVIILHRRSPTEFKAWLSWPPSEMPDVGDKAPEFSLYDQNRKVRQSSEFVVKGRKTVIAFFPGAFTGACTQEMCTFRDMYGELEKMKGSVVGISVDAPFAQKAFADKNGLTFPLLCDFRRETIQKYNVVWNNLGGVEGYVCANRAIFIVDDKGKIAFKWVAPDPGTLPDFEAIKRAVQ